MSGEEIKKKIDYNNSQIELIEKESLMQFVLNPKVAALIQENRKLQKECPHEFEEKFCKYCGIYEEE